MLRPSGRSNDEIRKVTIETGIQPYAEGSVLISCGNTRVICSASVEDSVPGFKKGSGEGWVTAEYSLLPRSTHTRSRRERSKVGGRTQEIQRLIGRALRSSVNLEKLDERSILIDCDVLQADGGTRTASITGAWIALKLATQKLINEGFIKDDPVVSQIAAISAGVLESTAVLDLDYAEDFEADVDMNFVMNNAGEFIEVQGTAEKHPFNRDLLNELLDLAQKGINELMQFQLQIVEA
jgi:ribonuclease PH